MSDHSIDCPHCGGKNADLWELDIDDGDCVEHDCGHCGKPFFIKKWVTVDYYVVDENGNDIE